MLASHCIGIPNILSLNLNEMICSVQILNATNSEPKVELSIVVCCFEYQDIGAELQNIKIPVCDLLIDGSPA